MCLLLLTAQEARAYTDPGTGMLIWQMLLAGLVGALFYARKALARLWGRKGKDPREENPKD